jgi:murein tripeptide amidase MpaA
MQTRKSSLPMPRVHFDRYYRYDDLTQLLHAFAAEFPRLVQVESAGKSYEGRDIWIVSLTNTATGPAAEKPALWADGNIHATEVSPSSACLHLIHKLTDAYGKDPDITRCLDTRAFYVCPRVNPDRAEWALADKPRLIRSSTRPYPYDEEPLGGLVNEDIDGDGRMLQMRVPDPNGQWKASEADPRLLVRREPTEVGGQYYRVLPEGRIDNYDGVTMSPTEQRGLDLNRNFPMEWRQENEQHGAGQYPHPSRKCAPSSILSPATRTSRAGSLSTPTAACCCGPTTTRTTSRSRRKTCGPIRRSARKGRT